MGGAQGSQNTSSSQAWSLSDLISNSISSSNSQSTQNSQSTSQNQSVSQGSSESSTLDSALSNEQLEILRNRENQYNEWFFPELQTAVKNADINSPEGQALMGQQASTINASFDASNRQIKQNLAQQGLLGGANGGVQASLNAQNQRSKSSALAAAYASQLGQMSTQKANLLGVGAGLMTTPTTSAQYHSTSSSNNSALSTGTSQSTSTGQSTSESASESHSEQHSRSDSTSKSKGNSWGFNVG